MHSFKKIFNKPCNLYLQAEILYTFGGFNEITNVLEERLLCIQLNTHELKNSKTKGS